MKDLTTHFRELINHKPTTQRETVPTLENFAIRFLMTIYVHQLFT